MFIVLGVADVVHDPSDWKNWASLGFDVICAVVPFVPSGVGKAAKTLNAVDNSVDVVRAVDDVADAAKAFDNAIDTYKSLKKSSSSVGKEVHHIVEKRFSSVLGITKTDEMLSIALDKQTHQKFTNAWRKQIKYGTNYNALGKSKIWDAAQVVYAEYPALLEAARKTIFGV